jgi:uncharacterized membrane protein
MAALSATLVWAGLIVGFGAACAALYGRYRTLPAFLTGPAVCRLDDANGCQVLFRTRTAALLGVPNGALGILFYVALAAGWIAGRPVMLLMAGASAAGAMSIYLAYVLIRDRLDCRICWAGHFANAAIWLGLALRLLGTS